MSSGNTINIPYAYANSTNSSIVWGSTQTSTSYTPFVVQSVVQSSGPIYLNIDLPISKMPKSVFINGFLMTLGIFGSEAEVSYAPPDKLIFAHSVFDIRRGPKDKISIKYDKQTYHYYCDPDSHKNNTLKLHLISIIHES